MRDCFRWPGEHITLFPDGKRSFYFITESGVPKNGGLILHEYQSFPKLNEIVRIGRYEFKIVKNTMTKIELVRLKIINNS